MTADRSETRGDEVQRLCVSDLQRAANPEARVEVHSSDVLKDSGARRPVPELDAASDGNSRGKL